MATQCAPGKAMGWAGAGAPATRNARLDQLHTWVRGLVLRGGISNCRRRVPDVEELPGRGARRWVSRCSCTLRQLKVRRSSHRHRWDDNATASDHEVNGSAALASATTEHALHECFRGRTDQPPLASEVTGGGKADPSGVRPEGTDG